MAKLYKNVKEEGHVTTILHNPGTHFLLLYVDDSSFKD